MKIKVIAFDLIGVLAKETDYHLPEAYDKLERLFGKDITNDEFIDKAKLLLGDENINDAVDFIISNLYETKNNDCLIKIKNEYPNIKLVLATNHVSNIKKFVKREFKDIFDNVFISADICANKPNKEFFQKILDVQKINAKNMLFIDDNIENVIGADKLNIQTIHLTKEKNMYDEIKKIIEI